MADNNTTTSKARPSAKTEDDHSFISETNTSVKAEHISSASIPTTPVSPSFKLQMLMFKSTGFWAKCIGGPPNGYALYGTLIYGHPKGPTESYKDLAEHVVSMIKGNNANCACALCTGPSRILEVSDEQ
ncbi:hypothetical protein D6D03_09855 [Aureobasidium pullulans]|nr:hypothetical protein D6D03_09855 [Aureobasidium pullulans]